MTGNSRPRFRIFRLDSPPDPDRPPSDAHYRAFWQVEGRTYRVRVWSKTEWESRPRVDPPSGLRRLGSRGWMVLKPIDDHS